MFFATASKCHAKVCRTSAVDCMPFTRSHVTAQFHVSHSTARYMLYPKLAFARIFSLHRPPFPHLNQAQTSLLTSTLVLRPSRPQTSLLTSTLVLRPSRPSVHPTAQTTLLTLPLYTTTYPSTHMQPLYLTTTAIPNANSSLDKYTNSIDLHGQSTCSTKLLILAQTTLLTITAYCKQLTVSIPVP